MKKKYTIVASLTALVVLVSAAIPALAADNTGATGVEADIVPGPALGINAPQVAGIDEEITITVFDRQTSEPAEAAGVWLVSWEKAGRLRADITTLSDDGSTAASITDYESNMGVHGEFIDWTDRNGQVMYTFKKPGCYLLVAVKDGYSPGFTLIRAVKPFKALGIRAPRVTPVGEEATITVFDRQTKEPVEGAGVWLVSGDKAEELKADIASFRADGAADIDYTSRLGVYGELIDETDENGQVTYTFEEAGIYLLVAVKDGYFPGFTLIRAGSKPTADSAGVRNSARGLASLNSLRSANRVRSAKSACSMQPTAAKARGHNGWANTDILPE
jgi:hypothetical protein